MADSPRHKGWKLNTAQTELTAEFNNAERIAMDATGIGFLGAAPSARLAVTGDISAYNETTLTELLAALAAVGLITNSTTT